MNRPKPIHVVRALPENICEHREWAEFFSVKTSHKVDGSHPDYLGPPGFYVGPGAISGLIDFVRKRSEDIATEIGRGWDYIRIPPEVGYMESMDGYTFDTSKLSPDPIKIELGYWLMIRIYARAYRLLPMSDEDAIRARARIAELIAGDDSD